MNFPQTPVCEKCGKESATSFSYIKGQWLFTGGCTSGKERYYIMLEGFFKSPASTVDWLAHMYEKTWFEPNDFFDMIDRFREATQSYGYSKHQ